MLNDEWGYPESAGPGGGATNQLVAGPEEWPNYYPVGQRQSPINIQLDSCDLHQLTCANCGLSKQMQQELQLTSRKLAPNSALISAAQGQHNRRSHLDSVGNDKDYDDDDYCDNDELHQRSSSASSEASSVASHSSSLSSSSSSCDKGAREAPRMRKQKCDKMTNGNNIKTMSKLGSKQQVQNTRYCVTNKKIFLGYPRYLSSIQLCNTGHTWQISLPPELGQHTLLAGPPLGDREYRLAQLHCHWGEDCNHGSEHQINGKSFAAEIHFVHWNCSQFSSPEEASKHRHGLAVVGVLVQALDGIEQNRNKHLDKIIAGLPRISQPNSSTILRESKLDLKKLLPTNRWNYATYEGSLTTPPLSEVVDWILFLQPIQCSRQQIEQFRQLKCPTGKQLVKNCRPVQAHHNRNVSIWTHSHAY